MISSLTVTLCKAIINAGHTPIIEALLPTVEKFAHVTADHGIRKPSKELIKVGVKLLPAVLEAKDEIFAEKLLKVGVNILRQAVRKREQATNGEKGTKRKKKAIGKEEAMLKKESAILIRGLQRKFSTNLPSLKPLLQVAADLFIDAVNKSSKDEATELMETGLALLTTAIEENYTELAGYISEIWVETIEKAATEKVEHRQLIGDMLHTWVKRLSEWMKEKDLSNVRALLNSAVKLLQCSLRNKKDHATEFLTDAWISELRQAIHQEDGDVLLNAYSEGTTDIVYMAIKEGKGQALEVTEVGFQILLEAFKKEEKVAIAMAKSWINALHKASSDKNLKEIVEAVVKDRVKSLRQAVEKGDSGAKDTSNIGLLVLEIAIEMGMKELVKPLSLAWVNALEYADTLGSSDETSVDMLMETKMAELSNAIKNEDPDGTKKKQATAISKVGEALLCAAIEANHRGLVTRLSSKWVEILELAAVENEGYRFVEELIAERAEAFTQDVLAENETDAVGLGKVGEELLIAAVNQGHKNLVKTLSGCWAKALGSGMEKDHMVKVVLREKWKLYDNCKMKDENEEAELRLKAMGEVLRATREQCLHEVEAIIKETWKELGESN